MEPIFLDKLQKQPKKRFPVNFFLILLILLALGFPVKGAHFEDVSFVTLEIKKNDYVFQTEEFFEIIDLFDYILIPVNQLSVFLPIELNFARENETLEITHKTSGTSGKVDFKKGLYSEFPDLKTKTPILYEGDFFVAPEFLEKITGKSLEWNSRRQELYVHVDWEIPETEKGRAEEPGERDRPHELETLELKPTHYGRDISLGSIHYKITGEGRWDKDGDFSSHSRQEVYLHGRFHDWAVSLGFSSRLNFLEKGIESHLSVPLIRALYLDEYRIVIGDSRVEFPLTVGNKNLRGILYSNPAFLTRKDTPRVKVTGEAREDEWVYLLVNGEKTSKKYMAEDGRYSFANVPLINKRTNLIQIIRERPDGELIEERREIGGHVRILEEGISEVKFVAGSYQRSNEEESQGRLIGLQLNEALDKRSSFNLELLGREVLTQDSWEPFELGGIAGFSLQPLQSLILTGDFLFGGEVENLKGGFASSLIYTLSRGYLSSSYRYIPHEITEIVDKNAGKQLQVAGEYDFSPRWSSFFQGNYRESIGTMLFYSITQGQLGFSYRDVWDGTTTVSGILGTGQRDLETGQDQLTRADFDKYGLNISRQRRTEVFSSRTNLNYTKTDFDFQQASSHSEQRLELTSNISRRIGETVRLTNNLDLSLFWLEKELIQGEGEINSGFRWNPTLNTFVRGTGSALFQVGNNLPAGFNLRESKASFSLRRFLRRTGSSFGVEGSYNFLHYIEDSYFTLGFDLAHQWQDEKYTAGLNFTAKSPVERRETYQLAAGLEFGWRLPSEALIEFQAQRIYQNLFEEQPEHSVSVSINHALGFSGKEIFGQSYSSRGTHQPTIAGIVYLDKNQTGEFNEGDPVLENIPMALGGRRTETDGSGEFKFERVKPGVYPLHFDLGSLLADYSVITEEKIVEIRGNENLFFYFGLTLNGSISGRVFMDRNASGTFDEGDEPLSWVALELATTGENAYSRSNGEFYFENVPLGKHEIKVSTEGLPPNTVPKEDSITVEIAREDLEKGEILIPIRYRVDN